MKTKNLILGFALSLTILSCNKEENGSPISSADAKAGAQIDAMNDDVSNVVEEQEASTYATPTTGKMADSGVSELTTCATITRVPAFGTLPTVGQTVTKTINYGTGCTLSSGNRRSVINSIGYKHSESMSDGNLASIASSQEIRKGSINFSKSVEKYEAKIPTRHMNIILKEIF